jgi:ABC-2 type transport system ATP-binding protein
MGNAIETHELSRSFASGPALEGLSLVVEPGEVLALLGPNGAGKTTTVRLLNGVLSPDRGWSRVLGRDPVADGDEVRRHTGVLTENAGLDDRLTTRENLMFTARVRGFSPDASTRRVNDLLERFGMEDRADDLTQGFSTGQRKRVALARALLHDPDVLFLDEPTSGLDPEAAGEVTSLIRELAREEGATVFLCTHNLPLAETTCDRFGFLNEGRMVAQGRTGELIDAATRERRVVITTTRGDREFPFERDEEIGGILRALLDEGTVVLEARRKRPSLEDVYFQHIGRTPRERA